MKIHGVGVAVPISVGLGICEVCSAALLDEVPTASFCRGTGGCGWVLWKEPWAG